MSAEPMMTFVLVGPNAGKTVGFAKGTDGKARYRFKDGKMKIHATRVNGRFILMMKQLYSAHLEAEVPNGSDKVQEPRQDASGSKAVDSELTQVSEHPAAGSAIELRDDDGADSSTKEPEAKGRNGSKRSKVARKRKTKA